MSAPCGRHYPRGQRPTWHLTVLSPDGQRLVFATPCEDRKEAACLATEARSSRGGLRLRIYLRDPFGDLQAWD